MTVLRHNILDIIDKIIAAEGDQIRFLHKEIDRNTLIDQSGSRESVMGRRDDRAAMLLGLNGDCTGDRYVAGNNDTAGIHLNRTQLRFIAVSGDNDIALLNIFLHDIRIGGCDQYLAMLQLIGRIAHDQVSGQSLREVLVGGMSLGKHSRIIHLHVGFSDITLRDQAFQLSFSVHDRKRYDIEICHPFPCLFQ